MTWNITRQAVRSGTSETCRAGGRGRCVRDTDSFLGECVVFCQTTTMVAILSWFILAFPGLLTSSGKGDI